MQRAVDITKGRTYVPPGELHVCNILNINGF